MQLMFSGEELGLGFFFDHGLSRFLIQRLVVVDALLDRLKHIPL
jgi:hypothetical protein